MVCSAGTVRAADATWVFSVQATATAHASPPRLELHWRTDHVPVNSYTLYRKPLGAASWGEGVTLAGDATGFVDEQVEPGARYEYQIVKHTSSITGYGYVAAGVDAALLDEPGGVVLVIDRAIVGPLGPELVRLEQDLAGEGWTVHRHEVGQDESPASIRAGIKRAYDAESGRVAAVLLLGRIPIVRSGNLNADGHGARPFPADVFYGDVDGNWTDVNGDGVYDQSTIPSEIDLQVGRVDFSNLPGTYAVNRYPDEIELLRRYLNKNHAFRTAAVRPTRRALVGNSIGDAGGQAYAAIAYRNFSPLVGPENIVQAGTDWESPREERWFSRLVREDYLWAYGNGAGSDLTAGNLGTHGPYSDLWASDFVDERPKAAFYLLFGSWFGDWSQSDNLLRSALATQDLGLASAWAGRPHLFLHPMGTGETIGYGIRLSQNNSGTYQNQVQRHLRGVHVALLGDPTLRMHAVAPAAEASARPSGADVLITWKPSPDPVVGYHLYRATSIGGRFIRLTGQPITETRFVDADRAGQSATYMVRAVALHVGTSGSHQQASRGAFASYGGATGSPAPTEPPPSGAVTKPNDVVWVDDALPAGAAASATPNDRWNWVSSDPAPFSGSLAHRAENAPGLHYHYFTAPEGFAVHSGDVLFAYAFIDPANPPRAMMLTWYSGMWEHRAYWGENVFTDGVDGTPSRRPMGPMPPAGRWVRLEVPAELVDMAGRTAFGMGFDLYDGRVTWDRSGKEPRR